LSPHTVCGSRASYFVKALKKMPLKKKKKNVKGLEKEMRGGYSACYEGL
jgi:hypothetical protein